MAKQKTYLIVGLPHAGVPLLTSALEQHRDELATVGVRVPARSADEALRAAVEVRREHRAWGLRRKDVEGAWSEVCRRALKHRDTAVVGHELLAGAAPDEIALLVDGLAGTQVHVVVLAAAPDGRVGLFPDELDLTSVLDRWETAVAVPDRLHVVVSDPASPGDSWRALASLVGFDADRFPAPDAAAVTAPADAASLRLIAESSTFYVDHDALVELARDWARVVARRGYDVVGDLRALVPARLAASTDPARAAYDDRIDILAGALGEAVTEVGRLREQLALLRADQAKVQRKRRRRLAAVS